MIGNYEQHYAPVVCGQTIKGKSQYSGVANEILASMRLAAEKAMDRADANSNINKMCNIFGVKNV